MSYKFNAADLQTLTSKIESAKSQWSSQLNSMSTSADAICQSTNALQAVSYDNLRTFVSYVYGTVCACLSQIAQSILLAAQSYQSDYVAIDSSCHAKIDTEELEKLAGDLAETAEAPSALEDADKNALKAVQDVDDISDASYIRTINFYTLGLDKIKKHLDGICEAIRTEEETKMKGLCKAVTVEIEKLQSVLASNALKDPGSFSVQAFQASTELTELVSAYKTVQATYEALDTSEIQRNLETIDEQWANIENNKKILKVAVVVIAITASLVIPCAGTIVGATVISATMAAADNIIDQTMGLESDTTGYNFDSWSLVVDTAVGGAKGAVTAGTSQAFTAWSAKATQGMTGIKKIGTELAIDYTKNVTTSVTSEALDYASDSLKAGEFQSFDWGQVAAKVFVGSLVDTGVSKGMDKVSDALTDAVKNKVGTDTTGGRIVTGTVKAATKGMGEVADEASTDFAVTWVATGSAEEAADKVSHNFSDGTYLTKGIQASVTSVVSDAYKYSSVHQADYDASAKGSDLAGKGTKYDVDKGLYYTTREVEVERENADGTTSTVTEEVRDYHTTITKDEEYEVRTHTVLLADDVEISSQAADISPFVYDSQGNVRGYTELDAEGNMHSYTVDTINIQVEHSLTEEEVHIVTGILDSYDGYRDKKVTAVRESEFESISGILDFTGSYEETVETTPQPSSLWDMGMEDGSDTDGSGDAANGTV